MSTAFLVPILRSLHHTLVVQFWPCWLVLTAAVITGSAWGISRSPFERGRKIERGISPDRRQSGSTAAFVALGALLVFLLGYIALMLAWEDFSYYDNDFFIFGTLKGHEIPPPIWPAQGRFFPLAFQEFDLTRHFTNTVIGYHVFPIVEVLLFVFILLALDKELHIAARTALAVTALLTPSILISFGGLIFPERNELLFLAGLILCINRFEKNEAISWAAGAVACAQIMVYYKETAFLVPLGLAGTRLLLRSPGREREGRPGGRLCGRQGRLDLALVAVAGLFLLYYFGGVGLHHDMNYAGARRQLFAAILLAYARLDFLAWLLVAVAGARIWLILRRRMAPLPSWDGVAVGGVACLAAYLSLGIVNSWYLAPVDLIAVLYVGRFAVLSLATTRLWQKYIVSAVAVLIIVHNLALSAVYLYERKNDIHARAEIARVIAKRYDAAADARLRLFFPFANPYVIMEFASYLDYRGVPVDGVDAGRHNVVLAGRGVVENGLCVPYHAFRCYAAARPDRGDLVIVLPDDEASRAQAAAYRTRGEVFRYEPRPQIPGWARGLVADVVGNLRMASPFFTDQKLPDRSMDASVTVWP